MNNRVADRLDIADALHRYTAAVDTLGNNPVEPDAPDPTLERATAQLRTCIAEDGRVFLYFNGPDGPAIPAGDGGPDKFGRFVRSYFTAYGYLGTYHLVGNIQIDFIDDDRAQVHSYINSTHWMAGDRMLLAPIDYNDVVVRDGAVWKIERRDILVLRFWVTDGYTPDGNDPTLSRPV